MSDEQDRFQPLPLFGLQSWLSPAFPTGSYSDSHGIEWAVETADNKLDSCRDGYRQIVLKPTFEYERHCGLQEDR